MEEMVNQSKGMAIASMVLGIVGLVLSCLVIGIIPCVIGLILGIVVLVKQKAGQGMAIAGIVTSLIGKAKLYISGSGPPERHGKAQWNTAGILRPWSGSFDGGTAGTALRQR